jgi:hypothetical protein
VAKSPRRQKRTQKFVAYESTTYGGRKVPVYGTVRGVSVQGLGARLTPQVAAQLLQVAARLIRQGKPLPLDLREHVAGAFETVGAQPAGEVANKELLRRLGLRKGTPGAWESNWLEIGAAVEAQMRARPGKAKWTQKDAIAHIASVRGMKRDDVTNRLRKYREKMGKVKKKR